MIPFPNRLKRGTVFILLLISFQNKSLAQNNSAAPDFSSGASVSGLSASAGFQSANLSWVGISFNGLNLSQAGYLVIYATSRPSMSSQPNGQSPDIAVENGVVAATTNSQLPVIPATTVTASGLDNGTTYYFMVVPFAWDGTHENSYIYSQPAIFCVTLPPYPITALNTFSSGDSVSGNFSPSLSPCDGYLIAYANQSAAPVPANDSVYQTGQVFGGDTVLQSGSATSFQSGSEVGKTWTPGEAYYVHVYSYKISACNGLPVYSAAYISDSIRLVQNQSRGQDSSIETAFGFSVAVEPNPVENSSFLKIETQKVVQASIAIFGMDGKIIGERILWLNAGNNLLSLNPGNLSPGIYLLQVLLNNGNSKTVRFLKK
jgi:hypothetical protein